MNYQTFAVGSKLQSVSHQTTNLMDTPWPGGVRVAQLVERWKEFVSENATAQSNDGN